jgi:hypothetical protein
MSEMASEADVPDSDPAKVRIDWPGSVAAWIARAQTDLLPRLEQCSSFVNAGTLTGRFRAHAVQWEQAQAQGGNSRPYIRALIDDGNEAALAAAILDRIGDGDTLHYEPSLSRTPRSLDFLVRRADGSRCWFDVKSVRPQWDESDQSWQRFLRIAEVH